MIRTALALALALVVLPGCGKKDKEGGAAKTTEGDKAAGGDKATGGDKAAAGGKPIEMEAKALYEDYNKPGQDGMALMKKWEPGVIVTGTVTQVITEESGKTTLWLGAGEGNKRVSVDFKDEGKAAKDKAIKKDDKVTAQCKIGGSDGMSLMMLLDCDLK